MVECYNLAMKVRCYQADDREAVIALWLQVFPNSTGHNDPAQAIDRKLHAQDQLFFVAEEGGRVVGTVIAGYDGHRGWLYSLAVDPSQQRRGIGTTLVRQAEQALSALGCPKLNLQVRGDNADVVEFYKSLGYETEERISLGKRLPSDRMLSQQER